MAMAALLSELRSPQLAELWAEALRGFAHTWLPAGGLSSSRRSLAELIAQRGGGEDDGNYIGNMDQGFSNGYGGGYMYDMMHYNADGGLDDLHGIGGEKPHGGANHVEQEPYWEWPEQYNMYGDPIPPIESKRGRGVLIATRWGVNDTGSRGGGGGGGGDEGSGGSGSGSGNAGSGDAGSGDEGSGDEGSGGEGGGLSEGGLKGGVGKGGGGGEGRRRAPTDRDQKATNQKDKKEAFSPNWPWKEHGERSAALSWMLFAIVLSIVLCLSAALGVVLFRQCIRRRGRIQLLRRKITQVPQVTMTPTPLPHPPTPPAYLTSLPSRRYGG